MRSAGPTPSNGPCLPVTASSCGGKSFTNNPAIFTRRPQALARTASWAARTVQGATRRRRTRILPHTTVILPSSTPKTNRSYVETSVDRTQRLTLVRYRAMAYVVGVGLLVLVGVGVPLQYLANEPAVVSVAGPIHGFLYIVYLLSV